MSTKDYYSLLSNHDRQWMNDCVHEVIHSYNDFIVAFIPLPVNRQPNYNKHMREFVGSIYYYKKIIRAERVEVVQGYNDSIPPEDIDYGRRDDGYLTYAIPDDIPKFDDMMNVHGFEDWLPEMFMIFQVDGTDDRYYVRSVKKRIGQSLLVLYRYDGTYPNGINLKDILVIDDEDNADISVATPLFAKTNDNDNANIDIKSSQLKKTNDNEDININTDDKLSTSIKISGVDSVNIGAKSIFS